MRTEFLVLTLMMMLPASSETVIFSFDNAGDIRAWRPVNDGVMGGLSAGRVEWTADGALRFFGEVSLENNGGFASLQVGLDSLDLSAFDHLVFRVRGDGKRYALSVQTDYPIRAGAYYYSFDTNPGQWQEIRAPMRTLTPRSFGRALRGAPGLNASDVRSLGFIISDKQEGPFSLEVDWIKAVNATEGKAKDAGPGQQQVAQAAGRLIRKAIERGAPLFNAGQPEACAAVYEIAAHSIIDLSSGELPAGVAETLRAGLVKAGRTDDASGRAWALREALDAGLRILEQD